jgi:hypothetical protein
MFSFCEVMVNLRSERFTGRLQPFSEDTLGGGNLRGPNIPVP